MKRFLLFTVTLALLAAGLRAQNVNATVTASPLSYSASGGSVTFTVDMSYSGTGSGLALAIGPGPSNAAGVPAGWSYGSTGGTNPPSVAPEAGDESNFGFTYISTPVSPVSFTFTVNYAPGRSGPQTFRFITASFRPTGGALQTISLPDVVMNPQPSAPMITAHPTAATATVGQNASFTVDAAGFPVPTYQWQKGTTNLANGTTVDGTVISGATSATLQLTGVHQSDAGTYRAVATNSQGSAPSNAATLTINFAPAFTTQPPASRTVLAGNTTTLTVAADGNPAPAYAWEMLAPGATTWVAVGGTIGTGANTPSLAINATAQLNGTQFRCVASNSVGATPSNATTLEVQFAPSFTTHPASQTVDYGASVTFTSAATGSPAPSFQWKRNNDDVPGATSASLTLNNVTGANVGSYTVVASNGIGSPATSNAATLALNPGIGGFTPSSGSPGTSVIISGAGFTNASAVRFNGVDAAFTVNSDFQITATVPTFATSGPITVVPQAGATLTSTASFTVVQGARLASIAQRVNSTGGEASALATFSIQGSNSRQVLVRAIGPTLATFGVTGVMADPLLTVHNGTGAEMASNDNWGGTTELTNAFTAAGAFSLSPSSLDSALLLTLQPGTYSARVAGVGATTGVTLIEVYEMPATGASQRFSYASARGQVSGAANVTGFVLSGGGTSTVLIRGVGAGLGLPGALANPTITVSSGVTTVASNDNWNSTNVSQSTLAAATAAVGAMPLAANDSALVLNLAAGSYTVQISGVGATSGLALVEVFVVDSFLPSAFAADLIAPLPNKAANLGDTVTFAAPFIGKPAPTFQWRKNDADITGQTSATLTLANVTSADTAAYRVIMTNATSTVTSASAQLDVNKAAQSITFPAIATKTFGTDTSFTLNATASSGLPVSYATSNPSTGAVASLSGSTITIVNAGTITITASQAGNNDYLAAPDIPRTLTVNKGTASVALSGLAATYDGNPKPVTATTTPGGLTVNLTYTPAGGAPTTTAPTNAGTYAVAATVDDLNYQGGIGGSLVIAPASQTITFAALDNKTFGDADFSATASASSGLPVSFASSNNAVATVNASTGLIHIVGAGAVTITASQPGNANYNAAADVARTFTVAKAAASVALGNLAQTYTGTPRTVSATTTPSGLTVALTYAGASTAPTNAGSYAIIGTIVDNNYQGSASGTLIVAKADQTIAFAALPSRPVDAGTFTLVATASSGLPVSFASSTPAVASVSGTTVTLHNTGATTLTASQPGDTNYNAAPPVDQALVVLSRSQTITFAATELPNKIFGAAPFTITATSNRQLPITFTSSDTAVATVGTTGDTTATVTIVGAGTATITATQPGDPNTAAATPVPRTLTVAKADQTISFTAPATKTFGDLPFVLTADTTATGLTPTLSIVSGPATIVGNTVTLTGAGSVVVRAAQPGNANYNAAPNVDRTITVAKANQTIAFTLTSPILISTSTVALTGTATSTLPVAYASSNASVATVSGSTLTIRGLGTTTITASQVGNNDYNAATNVTQTLVVNPVAPIVTLPSATATAIVGSNFLYGPIGINALALPVTFTMSGAPAGLSVNPTSGNISGVPTSANTAPSYTLTLTATNSTSSHSQSFTLTLQAPAPIITSPAAASATAGAAFSYTATATPESGVTFSSSDLPSWLTLNATSGLLSGTAPASAGAVTVHITATNATASATLPLVIAIAASPNTPVHTGSLNLSGAVNAPFAFTPNFGPGIAAYSLGGTLPTGVAPAANFGTTGTISGTPTVAGLYQFSITAVRLVAPSTFTGSATFTLTINPSASAPVITFPTGGNVRVATVGTAIPSIQLGATPASTTTFAVVSGALPPGVTLTSAGLVSGTPTGAGTFSAVIEATQGTLTGPRATLVFNVAPHAQAPIITSSVILNGRVLEALATYTLTNTPNLAGTTYAATGSLPTGLTFTGGTTGTITGTPAAGTQGTYEIFVTGANTNGTGPALKITVIIAPPLNVPVVTSNGSASGQVGQPFNYQIVATNGPITNYGVFGTLPDGIALNNTSGLISGVPSTTAGSPASVTLTATNADGTSVPKALTVTIAPAPATPIITSATRVSVRAGTSPNYTATATESPTSFVATNLPAGLSLTPASGVINGTPTTSGTFTATLAAANAAGLGAATNVIFDIAPPLTAPAISSASTVTGQVGTALTYSIVAAPGPITSYAVTGTLPAGLVLNSTTGVISGSPTRAGMFIVQLTATSDGGTSLPQSLAFTINPDPNVPVITSGGSAFGTAGVSFNGSYTITATNLGAGPPYASSVSFDAVNLPAGLAVNTSNGAIQGTPQNAGTTVASVVASNASGTSPSRDVVIRIDPPTTAPSVTSEGTASAQVGVNFSYQIVASNTPTSYEVIGAPAWMTVNTSSGAIAGTPPNPPGNLTVSLLARNAAGASTPKPLNLSIAPAANTPVITSERTASGRAGTLFTTFQVVAAVPSGAPPVTSYLALGLPHGLTLDRGNGQITGTPLISGTFNVALSAANANGQGAAVTLVLTIATSGTIGVGN